LSFIRRLSFACLSLSCLFVSNSYAALILNPTFNGSGWNSVTQGVVNQAISDWTSRIDGVKNGTGGVDSKTVNFNVSFSNATTSGYLGQWQGSFSAFAGESIRPWGTPGGTVTHNIFFNADFLASGLTNKLWFDLTPGDIGLDKPFSDWDAVTVMRHEIGHMLGFSDRYFDNFTLPSQTNPWTSKIINNVFDPTGLNVLMEPGDPSHVRQDSLLMDTALSNAEGRIGISQTELQMLSSAYGYSIVAVPEPSTFLLAGVGLGVVGWRRRKTRLANPAAA
jgi:hypothetical protein